MCDASDYAVGAALCQKRDKVLQTIYYASRTLNDAQKNYTTTEKELLALVFALDKFRSYLLGSKVIVHTDHSALKYLFTKEDAKPRVLRWIMLLQEFEIEIREKLCVQNVVADHLSRMEVPDNGVQINEFFPDESIFVIGAVDDPSYVDIANYLARGVLPHEMTYQQRKKFFAYIKHYF